MKQSRTFITHDIRILANALAHIGELQVPEPGESDEARLARGARVYEITVAPYVRSKSEEQRKGFHWLCKVLGDELGYDLEDIKAAAKRMALGTKEIRIGAETYEVLRSSEMNDGKPVNRIEYGALIDAVYRLGADAGVQLPELDRFRQAKRRAA